MFYAWLLAIFIVSLLLLVPIHVKINLLQTEKNLQIELIKKAKTVDKNIDLKKSVKKAQQKPESTKTVAVKKKPSSSKIQRVKNKQPKPLKLTKKKIIKAKFESQTKGKINSGILLNSIENHAKYKPVTGIFTSQNPHDADFKFKKFKQSHIYRVQKYLNEEIDKPQVAMNFYSDGIIGVLERAMDKYIPKKTFVTKYGTKIDCAYIGVILCSW